MAKYYRKNGGVNKALANETEKGNVKTIQFSDLTPLQDTISPKKVQSKLDNKDNNKHLPVVFRIDGRDILEGGTHRTTADLINGKTEGKFIYIDLDNSSKQK